MTRLIWVGLLVCLLGAGGLAGSDNPVREKADSIHPAQQELVITLLVEPARKGSRRLVVEDASGIDARQWLLLRSRDGSVQETHCIKSVRGNVIKLTEDLRENFSAETQLIQGSVRRERGQVALLSRRAESGDDSVFLDSTVEINPLEPVILQSADGQIREAHCVKWVRGQRVRLFNDLRNTYELRQTVQGREEFSSVLQGREVGGDLEFDESQCCCPNKKAGK